MFSPAAALIAAHPLGTSEVLASAAWNAASPSGPSCLDVLQNLCGSEWTKHRVQWLAVAPVKSA